eukprot:c30110_g1_i1 orf=1-276(-)
MQGPAFPNDNRANAPLQHQNCSVTPNVNPESILAVKFYEPYLLASHRYVCFVDATYPQLKMHGLLYSNQSTNYHKKFRHFPLWDRDPFPFVF